MKKRLSILIFILSIFLLASCDTHAHTRASGIQFDANGHYYICDCGEKVDFEQHKFGTPVVKAATCGDAGSEVYTCSVCGYKKTVEIGTIPHSYDDPSYRWYQVGSDWCVEATAVCTKDSEHILAEIAQADLIEEKSNVCGQKDYKLYEAIFNNKEFTTQQYKVETGEVVKHSYGKAEYTWTKTGTNAYSVTAKVVCSNCKGEITETVTASASNTKVATCTVKEEYTYTATFKDAHFTKQTKVEEGTYGSHNYGTITYDWEVVGEEYYCTATKPCSLDASHNIVERVKATTSVTTEPTEESFGVLTCTATFTNSEFVKQTKTYQIDKLEPTYKYVAATSTMKEHYTLASTPGKYYIKEDNNYIEVTESYLKINASHTCNVQFNGTLTLITDENNLSIGDNILIIGKASNGKYYTFSSFNGTLIASKEITIGSKGEVSYSALTTDNFITVINYAKNNTVAGEYGLRLADVGDGLRYLCSKGSTTNTINIKNICTQNAQSWKLDISSTGECTLAAAGTNASKYLRFYESDSDLHFACFKTADEASTTAVYIYKFTDSKDLVKGTAASCSKEGTIDHFECSCGKLYDYTGKEIYSISVAKLAHTFVATTIDDIECEECSVCGARRYSDAQIVQATISEINKLGSLFDSNFRSTILEAKDLYSMVKESDKSLVTNYSTLVAAEAMYDEYKLLDLTSKDTMVQAIINSALSYTYKLTEIQYDQYTYRRNYNTYVEDCNEYNWTYLDCSSFTNSVYNYSLGLQAYNTSGLVSTASMETYAESYYGNKADIIYYEDLSKRASTSKTDDEAKLIYDMLQPGDYYIYRHGSAGHVMVYVGDLYGDGVNYFIHSTGSAGLGSNDAYNAGPTSRTTEDQTVHEKNLGSLCIDKAEIVFEKAHATEGVGGTSNRYIFNSSNTAFAIIRPVSRATSITTEGQNKLMYRDLNMHKTASVNPFSTVRNGDTIEFGITLKNESNKAIGYTFVDEIIPAGTEVTSASSGAIVKDGHIMWHINSINANSTTKVTYTLKATGSNGDVIKDYNTYVNGVKLANYCYSIGAEYTKTMTSAADSLVNDSTATTSMAKYINTLYTQLGYDISSYIPDDSTSQQIVQSVLNKSTLVDGSLRSAILENLYGGYSVRSNTSNSWSECRSIAYRNVRNVKTSMLTRGDIIVAYWDRGSLYDVFFFTGDKLLKVNDSGVVVVDSSTTTDMNKTLHTLAYYASYAVVRLSLILK